MKDLESNLLKWLHIAAKKYQKENGGTSDLFEFVQGKKAKSHCYIKTAEIFYNSETILVT